MNDLKEKRYFKVFYTDIAHQVRNSVVGFGDNYRESDSYHENLLDIVSRMVEDGGLWVDTDTLVPFHRIIMFRPANNGNSNNIDNGNNVNNKNIPNNTHNSNNTNNVSNGGGSNNRRFPKKGKRIRVINKIENSQSVPPQTIISQSNPPQIISQKEETKC